jgi:hypothetical protein
MPALLNVADGVHKYVLAPKACSDAAAPAQIGCGESTETFGSGVTFTVI